LRFDGTLGPPERDGVARRLTSAGIAVASWTASRSGTRTYASLSLSSDASVIAIPGARFTAPPPIALEIVPGDPARLARLREALAGPGAPLGLLDAVAGEDSLLLELSAQASLRLVIDVVAVELGASPGSAILPLLPLPDEALTALAAATLGVADLDAARLIERYSEPLLAGGSG
jgi:hypothetical protein